MVISFALKISTDVHMWEDVNGEETIVCPGNQA